MEWQMPSEPLRSRQLAVQLDSARLGEVFLLQLQLGRQVQQAHLALFFRQHFVEEGEVIAEEHDGAGVGDWRVLAQKVLEENGRHRRDVFMTKAQIGARESSIAGLHRLDTNLVGAVHHVARKNLLRDRHRPRLGVDRRQKNLALQAGDVKRKQPAVFDHLTRDLVFAPRKFGQRDFFAAADLVDQAEVGSGQHARDSGSSACKSARCFPRSPA